MFKLLLEVTDPMFMLFGAKAEGAKAATEPAESTANDKINFILFLFLFGLISEGY
jgi:hypothetical protein